MTKYIDADDCKIRQALLDSFVIGFCEKGDCPYKG